jgi:type VI secretion system protein ImpE
VALVPTRYAGTLAEADDALLLARKTEWIEMAEGQFRGVGQRVLTTSGPELGLLEARDIVLTPAA